MSYYCYLIRSYKIENSSRCYVGFTTSPSRRIRQHNGEITSGAKKTSVHRPWKYILIVSGFPNKIVALQFEWQLQHPFESRIVRNQLEISKKWAAGWKEKLQILSVMLKLKLWKQLHLKVHFFDSSIYQWYLNKLSDQTSFCNCINSTDDIPKRVSLLKNQNQSNCVLCSKSDGLTWKCIHCDSMAHLTCTASQSPNLLIPSDGKCSVCQRVFQWSEIVHSITTSNNALIHEENEEKDNEEEVEDGSSSESVNEEENEEDWQVNNRSE